MALGEDRSSFIYELSVVLITKYGGVIDVESILGTGTILNLYFQTAQRKNLIIAGRE